MTALNTNRRRPGLVAAAMALGLLTVLVSFGGVRYVSEPLLLPGLWIADQFIEPGLGNFGYALIIALIFNWLAYSLLSGLLLFRFFRVRTR